MFVGGTDVEAETPILWPPDAESWLIGKDPNAGKDWGQLEKGMTENEMVGWYHWLNAHGWTPEVEEEGGLACCGSWGREELDTTEQLNWTELNQVRRHLINLLNEHESIFSFLSTSDFSFSLVQTCASSVPWKCGGRSKRKLVPFPLYFLSLGSTSNALKLCNYKKMGNATEKKAFLVWFSALAIRLVSRIIMTQNAKISI